MTSDDSSDIATKVRKYVLSRFPLAQELRLADDDSLLDSGIIDSLGILDLVSFVENEFAMRIGDDDLSPDNFGSVAALRRFVERKR